MYYLIQHWTPFHLSNIRLLDNFLESFGRDRKVENKKYVWERRPVAAECSATVC